MFLWFFILCLKDTCTIFFNINHLIIIIIIIIKPTTRNLANTKENTGGIFFVGRLR